MFLLLFGFFLLASSYTANKFLLDFMPVLVLTSLKLCLSGCCFLTLLVCKRKIRGLISRIREDLWLILFICVVTTAIPYFLKMLSLKNLSSSQSMLIGGLDPFITAVFTFFLFNEKPSIHRLSGIFLGLLSLIILFYYDSSLYSHGVGSNYFIAFLQGLLSVIIGRYGWIRTQRLLLKDRYTISEMNCVILLGGGGISLLTSSLFSSEQWIISENLSMGVFLILLYSAIIGNVIAYYIYSYSLKKFSIATISYSGLVIPFSGHFLGWFFLGESLSKTFFLAIILILFGYRLYFYQRKKEVISYNN